MKCFLSAVILLLVTLVAGCGAVSTSSGSGGSAENSTSATSTTVSTSVTVVTDIVAMVANFSSGDLSSIGGASVSGLSTNSLRPTSISTSYSTGWNSSAEAWYVSYNYTDSTATSDFEETIDLSVQFRNVGNHVLTGTPAGNYASISSSSIDEVRLWGEYYLGYLFALTTASLRPLSTTSCYYFGYLYTVGNGSSDPLTFDGLTTSTSSINGQCQYIMYMTDFSTDAYYYYSVDFDNLAVNRTTNRLSGSVSIYVSQGASGSSDQQLMTMTFSSSGTYSASYGGVSYAGTY